MSKDELDPTTVPFNMLGEDNQSTPEKLAKYTGVVNWEYLKPHYQSGALIFVDVSLSITETGHAIAEDDKAQIEAWLKSGDLVIPSDLHADWWEQNPEEFTALVVSPFVLMQPLAKDSGAAS